MEKTSPQRVDRIFGEHLKLYAGILINPWTGEEHKGLHTPMLTEDELHRILHIRAGRRPPSRKGERTNPFFPLRGTVLCASCERPLTASVSQGRSKRYPYYHCHNGECNRRWKTIRKAELEETIMQFLTELTPDPLTGRLFESVVMDLWNNRQERLHSQRKKAERRLRHLEARRQRIFEMREDGTYTREIFRHRLARVEEQIGETKMALPDAGAVQDLSKFLPVSLWAIRAPADTWPQLAPAQRARFQRVVLPVGISFDPHTGFGTARLGLVYGLFRDLKGKKSRGWSQRDLVGTASPSS